MDWLQWDKYRSFTTGHGGDHWPMCGLVHDLYLVLLASAGCCMQVLNSLVETVAVPISE